MKEKRKSPLLSAVIAENGVEVIKFSRLHASKKDKFDLNETLQLFTREERKKLWNGLVALLEKYLEGPGNIDDTEKGGIEYDPFDREDVEELVDLLSAACEFCMVGMTLKTHKKKGVVDDDSESGVEISEELFLVAETLHGLIFSLSEHIVEEKEDNEDAESDNVGASKREASLRSVRDKIILTRDNIVCMCELWWKNNFEGKEALMSQALCHLLVLSLEEASKAPLLKRIYSMREGLYAVDFEDDSAEMFRTLLMHCVIHPFYLSNEFGIKFCAFLFTISPNLMNDIHETIKNQIATTRSKLVLEAYGEIFFRAWKQLTDDLLYHFEYSCLQDLMYHAVLAPRKGSYSLALNLQAVLSHFHNQKRYKGVDEALLRLYEPIVWRNLKVANSEVRANAAAILFDAFPLQDPDSRASEIDEALQKQFDTLPDLFTDPCPDVRVIGVHGICRIISLYFELIPLPTTKSLLEKIVNDMAFDASANVVRVAVLQGLEFLLDNHLCVPLLKTYLAQVKNLIHDSSEKVRNAFISLLLTVKNIKSIKYYHVVPIKHLLSRLELETSSALQKKIASLLLNSYYPVNKTGEDKVTRCIALAATNAGACRQFYKVLPAILSDDRDLPKFFLLLCECLSVSIENDNCEKSGSQSESALSLDDMDIIEGVLDVMAILLEGLAKQLKKRCNAKVYSKIIEKLKSDIPLFRTKFTSQAANEAILHMLAHLPESCLSSFDKQMVQSLTALESDAKVCEFGPIVDCLCGWKYQQKLFELIDTSLEHMFADTSQESANIKSKRAKSRKGDGKENVPQKNHNAQKDNPLKDKKSSALPQAKVALQVLNYMLLSEQNRNYLLNDAELVGSLLCTLRRSMKVVKEKLYDRSILELQAPHLEQLCYCLESYIKLEVHVSLEENVRKDTNGFVQDVMMWCTDYVLPYISEHDEPSPKKPLRKGQKNSETETKSLGKKAFSFVEVILSVFIEFYTLGLFQDTSPSIVSETEMWKFLFHVFVQADSSYYLKLKSHMEKVLYQMAYDTFLCKRTFHEVCKAPGKLFNIFRHEKEDENLSELSPMLKEMLRIYDMITLLFEKASSCHTQGGEIYHSLKPILLEVINVAYKGGLLSKIMYPMANIVKQEMLMNPIDFSNHPEDSRTDLPPISSFMYTFLRKTDNYTNAFFLALLDKNIFKHQELNASADSLEEVSDILKEVYVAFQFTSVLLNENEEVASAGGSPMDMTFIKQLIIETASSLEELPKITDLHSHIHIMITHARQLSAAQ
eukprot:Nk52_evm38s621 gene=Nk52_evmTU38s621